MSGLIPRVNSLRTNFICFAGVQSFYHTVLPRELGAGAVCQWHTIRAPTEAAA